MGERLTEADAENWRMDEATHFDGGEVFFAWFQRCIEQPRLSRLDRYEHKTRSATRTWQTDDDDKASLAEAIEALNSPPTFSPSELDLLALIPDDYELGKDMGKSIDWGVADRLQTKGTIEWHKGRCRRTDFGRAALSKTGGGE